MFLDVRRLEDGRCFDILVYFISGLLDECFFFFSKSRQMSD